MSTQRYLIDTNVIIGLEDNQPVQPAFAELHRIATRHGIGIFVHEAARDDLTRDEDRDRRRISLSKLAKFQTLSKVRGLAKADLEHEFGPLHRPNDVVDATLLHALDIGAADFLVTQDKRLHERARRRSSKLGRRVLAVADAVELLRTTFEQKDRQVNFVEEVPAHTIPISDRIFDGLRKDYPGFDTWWKSKCVREHRSCWVVDDDGLAGLVVRKEESSSDTDATLPGTKFLKLCTFKVSAEKRGIKLGELLLKKVLWFAQSNNYDVVYITAYQDQETLIDLLEYYGFHVTGTKQDGELILEKKLSRSRLMPCADESTFLTDRLNYPRFVSRPNVDAFVIPIRESYHDTLYPELRNPIQLELVELLGEQSRPGEPGNTIRKVYLCRAQSNLGPAGSLLFFYKGKSMNPPSQALTVVGVLEEMAIARSTLELIRLVGGRSVYNESELLRWGASEARPVKVINYLLNGYIDPPVSLDNLRDAGIIACQPPQSIFRIDQGKLAYLMTRLNLGFDT
ncbi:MAG: GNAT family N-acetyltransferase [Chloroflexi bacterium]|nr:GNAT family N-acetyltransferase [Chloroflexota bacterium]